MSILKYNNRILTDLDPNAKLFFERAGLNSESNLDVDGLYTAEQARYWVNWLVKALKTNGFWENGIQLYLGLGGTNETVKHNLFSNNYNLSIVEGSEKLNKYGYNFDGTFAYNTNLNPSVSGFENYDGEITIAIWNHDPSNSMAMDFNYVDYGALEATPGTGVSVNSIAIGSRARADENYSGFISSTTPFYGNKIMSKSQNKNLFFVNSVTRSLLLKNIFPVQQYIDEFYGSYPSSELPDLDLYFGKANGTNDPSLSNISMVYLSLEYLDNDRSEILYNIFNIFNRSLNRI